MILFQKRILRLHLLKQFMLSLVKHQMFLRVMDIKESDLFEVDRVYQNFARFYSQVNLGLDNDESDGHLKRVKTLSK